MLSTLLMPLALAAAEPPVMTLLDKAACGQQNKGINENGSFTLYVEVSGASGLRYNCSTTMASANAHPAKDCDAWLPSLPDENLNISLRAVDEAGAVAACMVWELATSANTTSAEAWALPARGIDDRFREELARLPETDLTTIQSTKPKLPVNGSGGHYAGRKVAYDQYLDSMSHNSHRCVPEGAPGYWPVWQWPVLALDTAWAFPPTAKTATAMRLSHALLASSGVVWSIDRTCLDDIHYNCIGPKSVVYESCIKHIPGLPDPHCHLICNQTWALAPGGLAQPWGRNTLTHHIPSPSLSAIQDSEGGGAVYGDLGCGGQ